MRESEFRHAHAVNKRKLVSLYLLVLLSREYTAASIYSCEKRIQEPSVAHLHPTKHETKVNRFHTTTNNPSRIIK